MGFLYTRLIILLLLGDDRQQLSSAYTHFIAACLVFLKQNKTKQVVTFLKTKKVSSTLLAQESVFFKENYRQKF
jgi:hypothetical protein